MNHQQIREELSKAEQTQKSASESIARLTKLLNEPEGCWKPEYDADGYIVYADTVTDSKGASFLYHKTGNCFPTKEAAELHVKRLKVIQKLKEMAGGFKPDWKDSHTRKWFIAYNHEKKNWQTDSNYWLQGSHVYFETEAIAQAAITTLGDELNVLLEGV